jgi:hypothetical protein
VLIYAFSDRRVLSGAKLYLAQRPARHEAICGNSIVVWFRTPADRDSFEAFVLSLSGACEVKYNEEGSWAPLPRWEHEAHEHRRAPVATWRPDGAAA